MNPKFKGKPLVKKDIKFPEVDILQGEFGKYIFEEYQGRLDKDYKNIQALDVISFKDNIVKGSNPFSTILIQKILRDNHKGLNIVSPKDIEEILELETLNLRGTYKDTALVLRSNENPNKYLADNIIKQIKEQKGSLKYPIMVPLQGLDLVKDQDSEYGLSFKLREDTELISAPELDNKNNNKTFSKTNKKGLPIFSKQGNRTLYTRNSAIARLYLDRDLVLNSGWGDLDSSGVSGRVVIKSAAGAEQNFEHYISKLREEKETQIAKIEEKYKKALNVLKK